MDNEYVKKLLILEDLGRALHVKTAVECKTCKSVEKCPVIDIHLMVSTLLHEVGKKAKNHEIFDKELSDLDEILQAVEEVLGENE